MTLHVAPELMHALGQKVLLAARRVLLGHGLGVTLIIHESRLGRDYRPSAVLTTLPTRRHQRAVMVEAVVGMGTLDGLKLEGAAGIEAALMLGVRDVMALDGGELDAPPEPELS